MSRVSGERAAAAAARHPRHRPDKLGGSYPPKRNRSDIAALAPTASATVAQVRSCARCSTSAALTIKLTKGGGLK